MSTSGDNNFLIHFGIKGQKWGIRRFRNQDGTLTPEGKDRYASGNADSKRSNTKKKASEMNDQELEERIRRLRMEQQYNQLLTEVGRKPVNTIKFSKPGKKKNGDSTFKRVFIAPAIGVAASVMTKKYQKIAGRITP